MADNMKALESILDIASFRQRIISSNIANADTPGYRAQDVSFGHELSKALAGKPKSYEVYETVPTMPSRDGNTVNVDLEMSKMAETTLLHNSAAAILTTKFRMIKDVAKAGGA